MDLAEKMMGVYRLVVDLNADERRRLVSAVLNLCGDAEVEPLTQPSSGPAEPSPAELENFPPKAIRWLTQNRIQRERLEEFFHLDGDMDILVAEVPGTSKREQTKNCYLVAGARALLSSGEATVSEGDVVALCKRYKCYDSTNHATYRKQAGNYLAGDKGKGFTLSAPGLRAAADLLRK